MADALAPPLWPEPQAGPRQVVSAAALVAACLSTLWSLAGGAGPLWVVAGAGIVVFVALEWRHMPGLPRKLVVFALALLGLVTWQGGLSTALVADICLRAGYFAFFFTALGFLSDAAQSSPTVHACGMAAVRQPPTRRYWVMTASGHFLSVLLMAGAGSVLGAAIRSATDPALGGDPAVHAIRRRRMSNAMIRGVGSVAMWAPSSLMLGLLFVVLPELEWRDYVAYGLVTVVLMLAVGAAMDWVTRPRPVGTGAPVLTASPRELYAFVPLLLLVLLIFALSLLLRMVLPLAQLPAILSCALVVALGWIAVQDGVPGAATRLRRRAVPLLVSLRAEVCILAAAGMIGPLVLTLQSADRIEEFIAWLHLSGAATLVLASWVIVLLGQIGISPIVSVSVLAEPLWHLSSFDFSGTELILALMIPTVVFAITSPLSVIVRASASAMQLPVESVGRAWNWAYGLVIMLCLTAALFVFV